MGGEQVVVVPSRSWWSRVLAALRVHRHRPEPDLSAVVAFPACRCGQLIWPPACEPTEPASTQVPEPGRRLRRSPRPS